MAFGIVAKVPFADKSSGIAGGIQCVGERGFGERETIVGFGIAGRVEFKAKSLRISAGEKRGAGGTTDGSGGIAVKTSNAFVHEAVDARCLDVFGGLATEIGIAEIVGDDDDDVGWASLSWERSGEGQGNIDIT